MNALRHVAQSLPFNLAALEVVLQETGKAAALDTGDTASLFQNLERRTPLFLRQKRRSDKAKLLPFVLGSPRWHVAIRLESGPWWPCRITGLWSPSAMATIFFATRIPACKRSIRLKDFIKSFVQGIPGINLTPRVLHPL
jgi:hypothetical protein